MFIQPSVFLQLSLLNNYFNYSRTSSYIFVTETLHKYEKRCFPGNCRCYEARYNKDEMKLWYFDIASFKPESGFEFTAGSAEKSYLHKCKVTEVVVGKKLSYSWRYDGYPGNSVVTFELFEEGNKTSLS